MSTATSKIVPGYERVISYTDSASGLHAIIAIHDTTLGPALGGCRMFPYADEEQALEDVLRLSRGMTYKSAMAELPFGGGKSVIIGTPASISPRNYSRHSAALSIVSMASTSRPRMSGLPLRIWN